MSGRFQGRRRNTGRGRPRTNQAPRNVQDKKDNKELKFHPFTSGRERQGVSFEKVKEAIILRVQREYDYGDDVADGLRNGKEIDIYQKAMPILNASTEEPPWNSGYIVDQSGGGAGFDSRRGSPLDLMMSRWVRPNVVSWQTPPLVGVISWPCPARGCPRGRE